MTNSIVPVEFAATAACGHEVGGRTYPTCLASNIAAAQRKPCVPCKPAPSRSDSPAFGADPMTARIPSTWIRTTDRATGRQLAVTIPSTSRPGRYHLVTSASCDRIGFSYRETCSHFRTVQAEIEGRQAPPVPVTILADGIPGSEAIGPAKQPLVARLSA